MEKSWATSGEADTPGPLGPSGGWSVDLHLDAPGRGSRSGVRRSLTDALRAAVRGGRLAPGTRLPSSRTLAADLGVARNTVADAYADLVAEGWLTARQGSGTRVAARDVPRPVAPARPPRTGGAPVHDLTPGTPDIASFPRGEWLKAARRALAAAPNDALGYGDPRGRIELRTALAAYLSRARGVHAEPDRIVVVPGFVHGLTLLGELLGARGPGEIAVESYGLDLHWDRLERMGLRTRPLGLDEHGTRTDGLAAHRAVLLTPAHQFPIGVPLHPDRRAQAVQWARRSDGLILEDDYDGEFRYDRQAVGALQGLDPDRVVYLGTASKSLAPGLRIAWMVLPAALASEAAELKERAGASGGAIDQLTLAEFLTSGAYDRHVRSMRLRYRRRRDQLVAALAERAPEVRVTGIAAGLHAVLQLPPGTEQLVVQSASWQRLAVQGLSRFRHPGAATGGRDALVVGYGTPADHTWAAALDALCRSLP
ncbi:MocR-like pyridoxine biosynthesis transcription factor PdxR [Streptomyces sp. AN091965]|uniref:MocR-like pyridoxine biosynthesis transcription factor PdxR n=1 Tax=Streptomyces sp. AN091965 TaxID=2927803 RepID=UPI001F607276|nr:PLP-dependent aminotransferase family protein [Streptomyces sp. AN091965]MCI3932587.1 PLP-dependent aminotransferase family protein [Streptomyces sp. AN091965]